MFVSGLQGKMAGGAESVAVDQTFALFGTSRLSAQTCAGDLFGYGYAVNVSSVPLRAARFVAGEFTASGNGRTTMARTDEAMCYFTRIKGGFRGGGEWAQIRPELVSGIEHWTLRSGKGSASSHVSAAARCYSRDQR